MGADTRFVICCSLDDSGVSLDIEGAVIERTCHGIICGHGRNIAPITGVEEASWGDRDSVQLFVDWDHDGFKQIGLWGARTPEEDWEAEFKALRCKTSRAFSDAEANSLSEPSYRCPICERVHLC